MEQEVNSLKIKQQNYITTVVICAGGLLVMTIVYLIYRTKAKEKIQQQQTELNKTNINLLNLSLELKNKIYLLSALKEKDKIINKMREEVNYLFINYRKLQKKMLSNSPLYKELVYLANQNIPGNKKSLITDEQWKLIRSEITAVYSDLYNYIDSLCPNLPEQDFQYCCLYMYGFDSNEEAKLLNITPNSARTKRSRLREKLNISLSGNISLYNYLLENMH